MIAGHGGNSRELAAELGCSAEEIIDMSSNLNPFGPPPGLFAHLRERLGEIASLPEVEAGSMIRDFAGAHDLDPKRILAGNGSTQFIHALPEMLGTRRALIVAPTYADYADGCRKAGIEPEYFLTDERDSFHPDPDRLSRALCGVDTVFLCNPNNPTGVLIPKSELEALAGEHPGVRFVIDESYLPFVPKGEDKSLSKAGLPNIVCLNSMSKFFRIPGLRVGFLIASRQMIRAWAVHMQPWAVNSLAQEAVRYLMQHRPGIQAFVRRTRRDMQEERAAFAQRLAARIRLKVFPSAAYFLLARLENGPGSGELCRALGRERILIRDCANFQGLSDRFIRISLKKPKENQALIEALSRLLPGETSREAAVLGQGA
ncbi:MAG: threonine-phosphate decarboxylase CobD [Thermodesulfobacteriota bacterium]